MARRSFGDVLKQCLVYLVRFTGFRRTELGAQTECVDRVGRGVEGRNGIFRVQPALMSLVASVGPVPSVGDQNDHSVRRRVHVGIQIGGRELEAGGYVCVILGPDAIDAVAHGVSIACECDDTISSRRAVKCNHLDVIVAKAVTAGASGDGINKLFGCVLSPPYLGKAHRGRLAHAARFVNDQDHIEISGFEALPGGRGRRSYQLSVGVGSTFPRRSEPGEAQGNEPNCRQEPDAPSFEKNPSAHREPSLNEFYRRQITARPL